MVLFNFLFRFHLAGSGLSSSELKITVGLDPVGSGLAGRVLPVPEGGDETATQLLAGFCVRCVTDKSESVSSMGAFSEESESGTALVCFDRKPDGCGGFVKNFVSVCCLDMVEFNVQDLLHTPNGPRNIPPGVPEFWVINAM